MENAERKLQIDTGKEVTVLEKPRGTLGGVAAAPVDSTRVAATSTNQDIRASLAESMVANG